jgi:hypothetical protein
MMEAIRSSETSDPIRVTRYNILENGILHSHRRENVKSYTVRRNVQTSGSHVMVVWLQTGSGLVIYFIGHEHTLQVTVTRILVSSAAVFNSLLVLYENLNSPVHFSTNRNSQI